MKPLEISLVEELSKLYPNEKSYLIERTVVDYVQAVIDALDNQLLRNPNTNFRAAFTFSQQDAYEKAGNVKLNGQRLRKYAVMQSNPKTSLIVVTQQGNNLTNKVSTVRINKDYMEQLISTIYDLDRVTNPKLQAKLASDETKFLKRIPVDVESLDSYISKCLIDIRDTRKSKSVLITINANLRIAKTLREQLVIDADGTAYNEEYWSTISSGRQHGHGLSLQSMHKQLRNAALGACTQIDFNACSYALLTDVAKNVATLDQNLKTQYVEEYIRNRSSIREKIANETGIDVSDVKTAFTSLGFGGRIVASEKTSLGESIGPAKVRLLQANETFKQIHADFENVTRVLNEYLDRLEHATGIEVGEFVYSPIDPKDGTKRTKNQRMAWFYQALETYAMRDLQDIIAKWSPQSQVLLDVHDAVYISNRVADFSSVVSELQQRYPLLRISQERITPIFDETRKTTKLAQYDAEVAEHRARTAQHEAIAHGYMSENFGQDDVLEYKNPLLDLTVDQYENMRRQRFAVDMAMHSDRKQQRD